MGRYKPAQPQLKDGHGGGGSGTTSRRHSVSAVHPRRATIVGFNALGHDTQDEFGLTQPFQGRSWAIVLHSSPEPAIRHIYASQRINLNISTGASFTFRQPFGPPSDGGLSRRSAIISPSSVTALHRRIQSRSYRSFLPNGPSPDIRLGGLVIVEADRGKVISGDDGLPNPGSQQGSKEINPKMNGLSGSVVSTRVPTRAIVSRRFTRWATPLIRDSTDPTYIVLIVGCRIIVVVAVPGIPSPLCDCAPVANVDIHRLPG
ncbi:hypothetical protein BKA82DRAFT_28941 [Pisolithus tinctorius]|uniref:Uncharacterized protein n=1 Tax=Pisolithus tinctorius Marx 270 TaxID=870435 RepID=A0A0C3NJQ5_PISTI|nr:hypothetical protein BKA82DRAFT_28941 [Pisolithus tinctorius]KIO01215.1 hypothetical protein M404DRAFT_28941 [Pisolithus tinctorius Marx 270]